MDDIMKLFTTIIVFSILLALKCVAQDARPILAGTEPSLSPNGKMVAYISANPVWISDLDGKHAKLLTRSLSNCHSPCWSPDGKKIVFASYGHDGPRGGFSIWLVNADGTDPHKLIKLRDRSDRYPNDQYPRWSPDGKRIVWTHLTQLWIADTNGMKARPLTKIPAKIYEYDACWSADGRTIAYLKSDRYNHCEIWTMDADGNNQAALSCPAISDGNMKSSRNRKFLFCNDRSSISQIDWKGNLVGPLVTNEYIGDFDVSPNRKFIVFDDYGPEVENPKTYLVRIELVDE